MKRWTNGLPGATKRLGAIMALRGLSASQPRMRADTHDGPEQNCSTSEALYIDAALTFVDLGSPSCTARPGHTFWHEADIARQAFACPLLTRSGQAASAGSTPIRRK